MGYLIKEKMNADLLNCGFCASTRKCYLGYPTQICPKSRKITMAQDTHSFICGDLLVEKLDVL